MNNRKASLRMDAFPHLITSNLCFLDLDLGQKGFQKSLGAFSAISARGVCHASAWVTRSRHLGVFLITRSLCSRVRVICVLLKARIRVSHAFASLPFRARHAAVSSIRSRRCPFLQNSIFVCFLSVL